MSLANVPAACQSAMTPLAKVATDCNLVAKGDLTAEMDLKAFSNITAAQTSCVCNDANIKAFNSFLSACQSTLNITAADVTTVGSALTAECAKVKAAEPKKSSAQVIVFGGLASVLAAFAFI
ncbi:hypothetical protein HDU80_006206 [Chytriomyces hyalinus]|nr:hypothetical protein HDU80_006206 [Chytriomyces hyalinus]